MAPSIEPVVWPAASAVADNDNNTAAMARAGRGTGDQCYGFYTGDPLSEYSTRQTTGGGAKTVGRVEEEEKGDPSP